MTREKFASLTAHEASQSHFRVETLLDAGHLPVEELAALAVREGRRPRPIYQVHRWFARRFGSAFRALLTAASLPVGADFWPSYYSSADWRGRSVLDPFVGGGTSVVEAQRLGARVTGVDVDAVACAITRLELSLGALPDLRPTLDLLKKQVGEKLAPYYRTIVESGEIRDVLHYFWVQVVNCVQCRHLFEAHPHYQLAYEAEGDLQWVFCPRCHNIKELSRTETHFCCEKCDVIVAIHKGVVQYGRVICPHCQKEERLIGMAARNSGPPKWKMFALEFLEPSGNKVVPMKQRHFQSVTEYDQKILNTVMETLQQRKKTDGTFLWIPDRKIPREGRADNRLLDYGYTLYRELFNPRQLLHLSYLAEAIDHIEEPIRQAIALAFSDHLITNCMMTHYAFGWRRLAPLFSVRAYRHMTRPVEINPWLDGTGRGTFPNAVRQIQRAIEWVHMPREALVQGGFCKTPSLAPPGETDASSRSRIIQSNSQCLGFLEDHSFDLVLSDPPYFDNIAYSELSDFFLPWLQLLRIIPQDEGGDAGFEENLAARKRDEDAMEHFQCALGQCFSETARVLKPQGRFVFTYQHKTAIAWHALASALAETGLRPIQLFPLLGDGNTGLHKHEGNSTWDAVFVFTNDERHCKEVTAPLTLTESNLRAATEHYKMWAYRLLGQTANAFRKADQRNFYSACLVAGALGLFAPTLPMEKYRPLRVLLDKVQRESIILHESHRIQDGL